MRSKEEAHDYPGRRRQRFVGWYGFKPATTPEC